MSGLRACFYFSLIVLCFHIADGKPFFFGNAFWCDFMCEDDDVSTTTVSSEDYDWMCTGCAPTPRRTTTVPPAAMPAGMPAGTQPLNLNIPNGNAVAVNMSPTGWILSFMPGAGQAAPPGAAPPGAAPGPAAAPTAAPAAAGTTPAPAGATTAAPGATTAAAGATTAATTAAPAG